MRNLLADLTIGDQVIKDNLMGPDKQKIFTIGDVINILTSFLYPIAGVLLFIYLAWGGFNFLMSRGEKEKVQQGKDKITAAIIGFFILMVSYVLVRLISSILGLSSSDSVFQ
jgi:hypothetical protein